jgi:hypothetical protein
VKNLLRFGAALLAVALLMAVFYLGVKSGRDSRFVVWFGIASAIVAPGAFLLFGYAFARSDTELIQRLSKVPEIERLITEAKTQEEKVRVLEAEQARLIEIIQLESRRQAARDRVETLERDAGRIIQELEILDQELRILDQSGSRGLASEEIKRLRQRVQARERGDVALRFGLRTIHIDRDIVKALPFGLGNIVLAYFRLIQKLQDRVIAARLKRRESSTGDQTAKGKSEHKQPLA